MWGWRWRRWKNLRVSVASWAWSRAWLCMGRLRLRSALTSSSGLSSGAYAGRKCSSIRSVWSASQARTARERWAVSVHDEVDLAVEVADQPVQEAAHDLRV